MKKQQHEKTSQDSTLQAAKEYVQRQMAIMEEHGKAPKLSADAYDAVVKEVAAAAKTIHD